MAIAKAERLMNLALCLLGTRRPLSKRELRGSIEAYLRSAAPTTPSTGCSSATRTTCANSAWSSRPWRTSTARSATSPAATATGCPPITLDAEEAAALGLAAKVWQQARLAGAASGALQKLRAAGLPEDVDPYEAAQRPRAAHPRPRGRLRAADAGLPRPPPGRLRLPQGQRRAPRAPAGRALGAGVLARPLVPGRLGPGPRRRAGLPALPDHRQGPRPRRRASPPRCPTSSPSARPWRAGPGRAPTAPPLIRLRAGAGYPLRAKAPLGTGTRRRLGRAGDPVRARAGRLARGVRARRGGAGARRAAGRRDGPAARRGQGLRGRKQWQDRPGHERHRPDPADAVPGDLSARAPRRPRRGRRAGLRRSPRTS